MIDDNEYIYVHIGNSLYRVDKIAYLAAKMLLSDPEEFDRWVLEVGVKVSHDEDITIH